MRVGIIVLLLFVAQSIVAQELKELRHFRTSDYKCDFYVSLSDKKVKHHDTLHYHWFKAQKIHVTQGQSQGNILNGQFNKFYHSGQLAEKGDFEMGLQDGTWKSWFESGKLKSIYHYNKGILAGDYTLYNEAGDIRESGKIRKGEKDVDVEKVKKQKKERKFKLGTHRVDEEKKKERQDKKEDKKFEREQKRKEKGKEGTFLDRLFKKDKKSSGKKPKKKKEKKKKKEYAEA